MLEVEGLVGRAYERRRVRPDRRLARQTGPGSAAPSQVGGEPCGLINALVTDLRPLDYHIEAIDEDRVGVVVGERVGLRRGRGGRLGGLIFVVVMVVVSAGAVMMPVMMVVVVTVTGRSRVRVNVRTKVVSGRLGAAVAVTSAGPLRQQDRWHQE